MSDEIMKLMKKIKKNEQLGGPLHVHSVPEMMKKW